MTKIYQTGFSILIFTLFAILALPMVAFSSVGVETEEAGKKKEIIRKIAGLHIPFIENRGQIDNENIQYYTSVIRDVVAYHA